MTKVGTRVGSAHIDSQPTIRNNVTLKKASDDRNLAVDKEQSRQESPARITMARITPGTFFKPTLMI